MSLLIHDKSAISVIGVEHGRAATIAPGIMVCHSEYRWSTYGIIVAVDEHHATVLWTREPPIDIDAAKFKSLAAPLVRRVNYSDVARKMIQVEPLPPGANVYYAKDDE